MERKKKRKGPREGTWEYSRIRAKERAKELMHNKSVYSALSLSMLFVLLAMVGIAAVTENACNTLLKIIGDASVPPAAYRLLVASVEFALLVFLVSPLVMGVFTYAARCVRGDGETAASALFLYYSGKERRSFAYRRALNFLITLAMLTAVIVGECALGAYVAQPLADAEDYSRCTVMVMGTLLFVIFTIVMFIASSLKEHLAYSVFDAKPDYPYSYSVRESARMMKGRRGEVTVMVLSFIPWMALSVLTLGVAFVFFVFPYYVLSNAALGERIIRESKRQEDL